MLRKSELNEENQQIFIVFVLEKLLMTANDDNRAVMSARVVVPGRRRCETEVQLKLYSKLDTCFFE